MSKPTLRVVPNQRSDPAPSAASREFAAQAVTEQRPGAVQLLWREHRALLAPYGWLAGADATAVAAHDLAHGMVRVLVVVLAAVVAGGWALVRARRRPRRIQRYLACAWAAGAGWIALTVAWTPFGPHALMQFVLLAGGLAVAAPHLYRHRRRPGPRPALLVALPAPEDPRLEAFRAKFCDRQGPLRQADPHAFAEVPDGFSFELALHPQSDGTTADVVQARSKIAKLYDVPADQVSVEYAAKRSEARAKVTVLTAANALARDDPWDGVSSYDPTTGTVLVGRFLDSAAARWTLHKPGSGAAGGVIAGVTGSGKTGTAHILACETVLARQCATCGPVASCRKCDLRRVAALWMGDPQQQPFSVWRGRADLTAWGPASCVRMLQWAHAVMRARAAFFGQLRWTDHLGRENVGKGWFDPSPAFPLLYVVVDEWPLIAADPDLGPVAIRLAADISKQGRKVGVALVFLTQIPDLSQLGDRAVREMLKAFNVVAHRTDGMSKYMLGIDGDPTQLPAGVHGIGYINGPDKRPAATFRSKHLPEYVQPGHTGVDVRDIAGRAAADPVDYDRAILDAIVPLGYTGPGQILDDDVPADATDLGTADQRTRPRDGGQAATGGAERWATTGTATDPSCHESVARLIASAGAGGVELYDVMAGTGISALDASQAVAALVAAGDVTTDDAGRYVSCTFPVTRNGGG